MISQFFILSARGDVIINRDFRSEFLKNTTETFFRNVKLYKGDAPPLFNIDGINFAYIKQSGLYVVSTYRFDCSPSYVLEILNTICKVIKDSLGVINQESIRKNFILIYEILDEMIDFGYPQLTSTETIKGYIASDPVSLVKLNTGFDFMKKATDIFGTKTVPSDTSKRPQFSKDDNKNKKNEIFVDVFEKLSILFNSSGYVINSSIEGCIQMKSYLHGNPPLQLALNDDLVVGKSSGIGGVILDDCNFHECVNTSDFEINRILKISPPDGEFVAMNYRVMSDFQAPFRIFPFVEEVSSYKLELSLKLKASFPKEVMATFVKVTFPLPKLTANSHNQLQKGAINQKVQSQNNPTSGIQVVEWELKKLQGGSEHLLKTQITLQTNANAFNARQEIGPINVSFEIPMFNVSNLQIKYLRIEEKEKSYNPFRWVRYVTQSSSYVCRT